MGCGRSRRLQQQPVTTCNYHYIQQGGQQYGSPCGGYGGYGGYGMQSYGGNPCGGGYGGYGGYY